MDYWIVVHKWTCCTENVEWTNEQEEQDGADQHAEDELVKALCWRAKSLNGVESITSPSNVEFEVVVEQLPELEDVESGLAESEVEQASDLDDEWNCIVHLRNDHTKIIVVLED